MEEIKFELAKEADVPAMRELITLSARGLSVGFYTPEQIESAIQYVFGVDTQLIQDQTYFIAKSGSQMVGCGGWSKRQTLYGGDQFKKSKPDPLIDPLKAPARIRAFFIHPEWGRKGIGSGILKECTEAARKHGFKAFELGSTLPGVPFYSALGFKSLDRVELSFPNGVKLPIILMRKEI